MTLAALQVDLIALTMVSVRVGTCWAIVPVMPRELLGGLPRAGVISAWSLVFVPAMRPLIAADMPLAGLLALAAGEAFAGLVLGTCIAAVFWAVESAAAMVDAQSGATAGSLLNPLSGNEGGALAILFNTAFVAYFVSIGGLAWILGVLVESYQVWPAGQVFDSLAILTPTVAGWWLSLLDTICAGTLTLVAPALAAMLFVELALGLVGRIAPQLQVFFVAMPLKMLASFFILALQATTILYHGAAPLTLPFDFMARIAEALHG